MTQLEAWPPPAWTEVIVTWSTMLNTSDHVPNEITKWCRGYPG